MKVLAPCPGRLLAIDEVPDPVFAGQIVGPGVAVDPPPGEVTVVSPVAGRLLKVHPHAFVVLDPSGIGVLVHLGIDTVRLEGRGFEVLAEQGADVDAGTPVVRWDTSNVVAPATSRLVPVVVMDRPADSLDVSAGRDAAVGDVLFEVP